MGVSQKLSERNSAKIAPHLVQEWDYEKNALTSIKQAITFAYK